MYSILFLLMLFSTSGFFNIHKNVGRYADIKYRMKYKDINHSINYKIPKYDAKIIKKVSGFYGMIGPEVNISKIKTLYDLFTGDGNIQGVFFDNGNMTFIKHYIKTEKLLFEEKNGKFPTNILFTSFMMFLNKFKFFPTIMGVANTALLQINNDLYAFFERDKPYKLKIDFKHKNISTVQKVNIPNVEYLSGHSKYDIFSKTIDSIEYHVSTRKVNYYKLSDSFHILQKISIPTTYIPIIHDFITINDKVIIIDSPFEFQIDGIKKIPVNLQKKPTKFHILNRNTNNIETFVSNETFYIFHYANVKETENSYEMYASIYDDINFSDLSLHGKYRKIVIHKITKKVSVYINKMIEYYNLDFPIKFNNKIIFRNIHNNTINGFVICDQLTLKKTIFLKDKYICGEPILNIIDNQPYLISFAYNKNYEGYILFINIKNSRVIEIPINNTVNIGFHSIFVNNEEVV